MCNININKEINISSSPTLLKLNSFDVFIYT